MLSVQLFARRIWRGWGAVRVGVCVCGGGGSLCIPGKTPEALTWKGGTGMCGPQHPLFTPLLPFTRPPTNWGTSPFTSPSFERVWNVTFPLQKQTSRKYDHFQLQRLKFDRNVCQKAWKFGKISVLKPLFFDENLLTSLHFHGNLSTHKPPSSEIRAAHTYQKKVECRLPPPRWGKTRDWIIYMTAYWLTRILQASWGRHHM